MRGVILAAGRGERLKDITSGIPKPMITFRGKPLLQHNIELCREHGVTELFINTHHLPKVIRDYFGDGSAFGVHITYSFERDLLGTSGALNNFKRELSPDSFFVLYGDNYSTFDLAALKQESIKLNAIAVIGFHWREDTSASGVADFDANGRVTQFIEKPKSGESASQWVNAGLYFLQPEIFRHIPEGVSDFAKDVFPRLIVAGDAIYGVCRKSEVLAFDTPEMYNRSVKH